MESAYPWCIYPDIHNALLRETVHGEEVDCNVFKTQLSVTNRIYILDRKTYGFIWLWEGQICVASKQIDEWVAELKQYLWPLLWKHADAQKREEKLTQQKITTIM